MLLLDILKANQVLYQQKETYVQLCIESFAVFSNIVDLFRALRASITANPSCPGLTIEESTQMGGISDMTEVPHGTLDIATNLRATMDPKLAEWQSRIHFIQPRERCWAYQGPWPRGMQIAPTIVHSWRWSRWNG